MDPLDEFEFRPITEGLGFHKKSPLQGSQRPEPEVDSIDFPVKKEKAAPNFRSRHEFLEDKPKKPEPKKIPVMPSGLPRPGQPTQAKAPVSAPARPTVTPKTRVETPIASPEPAQEQVLAINGAAILVDSVVVFAFAILFLVAVLVVTKVDLVVVLNHLKSEAMTQMSLVLLIVSVLQVYMVSLRSFFGMTLGEWAFDSQVGTAQEQTQVRYPLQVLARSLFITLTGLIVVPVVALITGRDIAAQVSGVSLYTKRD